MTEHSQSTQRVTLVEPEKMNLLGLLLEGIIRTNLDDDTLFEQAQQLSGAVRITAGEMVVTLVFDRDGITILSGARDNPRASVRGTMSALLGVVSGTQILPMVTGSVRVAGDPLFLARALPCIAAPGSGGLVFRAADWFTRAAERLGR